jgi:splicing factor 3A subunit 3
MVWQRCQTRPLQETHPEHSYPNPNAALEGMFSGEEAYGKYLDLHTLFAKYLNLKGVDRMDYLSYLSSFDRLYELPRKHKNADYKK